MSREDNLKVLDQRRRTKVALITDDDFSDVLQAKISEFKEVLGAGVELNNLDDLLENLQVLQSFQHEVKELKNALKEVKLPDTVGIEGLDALTKATEALTEASTINKSIDKLQDTFNAIHKAVTDDIYARYDWSNSATGPAGQYIGYLSQGGTWFIQKIGESSRGDKTSLFAAGKNDYPQNWRVHEKLKYVTRDKVIIS